MEAQVAHEGKEWKMPRPTPKNSVVFRLAVPAANNPGGETTSMEILSYDPFVVPNGRNR